MAMYWIVFWIEMARLNKWLVTVELLIVVNACFDGICNHSLWVSFSTHCIFFGDSQCSDFSSSALLRRGYLQREIALVPMRKWSCSFNFTLICECVCFLNIYNTKLLWLSSQVILRVLNRLNLFCYFLISLCWGFDCLCYYPSFNWRKVCCLDYDTEGAFKFVLVLSTFEPPV